MSFSLIILLQLNYFPWSKTNSNKTIRSHREEWQWQWGVGEKLRQLSAQKHQPFCFFGDKRPSETKPGVFLDTPVSSIHRPGAADRAASQCLHWELPLTYFKPLNFASVLPVTQLFQKYSKSEWIAGIQFSLDTLFWGKACVLLSFLPCKCERFYFSFMDFVVARRLRYGLEHMDKVSFRTTGDFETQCSFKCF